MSPSTPKLSAHRAPKNIATPALTAVARRRLIPFSSVKKAIEISLMEMVDVSEATKSRKKKSVDQITPPGSWWKMLGKTSKTSVGPAAGELP